MASLVEFPKAPLTPITIAFMKCRESRQFLGTYESKPKEGDVIAFIPYLDLPNYALEEERAIAFIDPDGFRGWISKEDVSTFFDMMSFEHEDCQRYLPLFERQGWEAIPIMWSAIAWDAHFAIRTDDNGYDMSPDSFFIGTKFITTCQWCGHPKMNNKFGIADDKCEACGWSSGEEEKDAKLRNRPVIEFNKDNAENVSGFLGEDWA